MSNENQLLIDLPLVADEDADEELGSLAATAIADEDLQGSRLLLALKSVRPIDIEGMPGGLIEISCTFQPGYNTRFTWARLTVMLQSPEGVKIVDLAPREIKDEQPVKISVDSKGSLGLKKAPAEASLDKTVKEEYEVYQCLVRGSGESTAKARWDFNENDHRQSGLGTEQTLVMTLPVTGKVSGLVLMNARLARSGVEGALSAVRDLVVGARQRDSTFSVEIPKE
ncbi:MAG: hypothetical protein AAFO84_14995 [Cyanobacteria bacterium J06598_1]